MDLKKIGRRNVVSISKESSVEAAAKVMRENHVGDVVVVDYELGREIPLGILTDRDIVVATVALGASTSALAVEDIMTTGLVTVNENDSVTHVIQTMRERGVKRLPIVGPEQELVGIVAVGDIIALLTAELSALVEVSQQQRKFEMQRRRRIA